MKTYSLNKKKYLPDDEYFALHQKLENMLPERDAVLIFTALYTGARASEVLAIRADDLDSKDRTVYIRALKGSSDREIPLPAWLFTLLKARAKESDYLFPITYQRLDQIWHQIRPVKKKFHALRHTFALRLYQRTKDIHLVKVALGHRSISNTMIYVDYEISTTEMRKLLVG